MRAHISTALCKLRTQPRSSSANRENFDPFHPSAFKQKLRGHREENSALRQSQVTFGNANIQVHPPPTAQSTAKTKQRGLTEPGGVTHFMLISPLTLLVLQVSKRLWLRVRISLLGCCISITGGATGTVGKKMNLHQKLSLTEPQNKKGPKRVLIIAIQTQ